MNSKWVNRIVFVSLMVAWLVWLLIDTSVTTALVGGIGLGLYAMVARSNHPKPPTAVEQAETHIQGVQK